MERTDSSYVIFSVIIGGVLILGATVLGNQSHLLTKAPQVEEQNTRTWTAPDRQVLRERTLLSVDGTTRTQDWFLDLVEIIPNIYNLNSITTNSTRNGVEQNENRFTKRLAQELRGALGASTAGGTNTQSREEVMMRFAAELVPRNFTIKDITVDKSTGNNDVLYLNKAGTIILESNVLAQEIPEMQLFEQAIRTNSSAGFQELAELSAIYRSIRDKLLDEIVPHEQTEKHLLLMNATHRIANSLYFMSNYKNDSFLATLHQDLLIEHLETLHTAYVLYGTEVFKYRDEITAFDNGAIFLALFNGLVSN